MSNKFHSDLPSRRKGGRVTRTVTVGFVTAILILIVITGLFARRLAARIELTDLVIQSHAALHQLQKLLTDVSDAESSALSYSLAGAPHYLPSYQAYVGAVGADLDRLRLMASNNENLIRRQQIVAENTWATMKAFDALISMPHTERTDIAHFEREESLVRESRKMMDGFRAEIASMQNSVEEILRIRMDDLEVTRRQSVALLAMGVMAATLIIGWLFWIVWMETGRRHEAQTALEHSHDQLERRVNERTRQLVLANDRLSALSKQVIQVQENERRRIARDLHDEVGHSLTAVKLNLEEVDDRVAEAQVGLLVKDSLSLIGQLLHQVRGLALELRPSLLDEMGLCEAAKWFVLTQGKRAGVKVTFEADSFPEPISEDVIISCFRVLQESMTNIAKHAHATSVFVSLRLIQEHLELRVCDNGVGYSTDEARLRTLRGECAGLMGMEERLRLLGGTLTIQTKPGAGTELNAMFPIQRCGVRGTTIEEKQYDEANPHPAG
jgi:signal transduction histidine kinase